MIYTYICQPKRLLLKPQKYSFCFKYILKRMLIIGIAGEPGRERPPSYVKLLKACRLVK